MMRNRLRRYSPAIVLFFAALGTWEGAVRALGIEGFILPAPSAIAAAFAEQWPELRRAGTGTFLSALGGLALGSLLAFGAGLGAARWAAVRAGAMPLQSWPAMIGANPTRRFVTRPESRALRE